MNNLDTAVLRNKAIRLVLGARDGNGKLHAVGYFIGDKNTVYYLAGGGDSNLRNSGAMSLLMWHAIKKVSLTSKIFDFEGSMIEPIERFFRSFGAQQVSYSGKQSEF